MINDIERDPIDLEISEEIARELLKIEAVFLRPDDPFTWASGIKSPIYCDNRLILTSPKTRDVVEAKLAESIVNEYSEYEVIMGTSTAGIAHAALAANILECPMGYVRGSAKDHGRTNQIEGKLNRGDKVVIVEDLISTAGSVIETAHALEDAGADVLGIVSIFTYGMQKGIDRLKEENLRNISLSNLDVLVQVALEDGYINEVQREKLLKFRANPQDEDWMKL